MSGRRTDHERAQELLSQVGARVKRLRRLADRWTKGHRRTNGVTSSCCPNPQGDPFLFADVVADLDTAVNSALNTLMKVRDSGFEPHRARVGPARPGDWVTVRPEWRTRYGKVLPGTDLSLLVVSQIVDKTPVVVGSHGVLGLIPKSHLALRSRPPEEPDWFRLVNQRLIQLTREEHRDAE